MKPGLRLIGLGLAIEGGLTAWAYEATGHGALLALAIVGSLAAVGCWLEGAS